MCSQGCFKNSYQRVPVLIMQARDRQCRHDLAAMTAPLGTMLVL